jgi:Holliday junction resolvasome RuvABC endonuclease subunit
MDDEDYLVQMHGHTFARVTALGDELVRRFDKIRPSQVACESAYFNRRTASAYAPLLMSINGIRDAVRSYNRFMPFTLIEPSVIRGAVGAKGKGRDKELVLNALIDHKEFKAAKTTTPLTSLSDHASDALAIAYARLLQMR